MPESGGPGWAEFTPRELVNMTADGRLRSWSDFRATHPAPVIEAALRGFPIPPLLLWSSGGGSVGARRCDNRRRVPASARGSGVVRTWFSTRSAARWWSVRKSLTQV